MKKEMKVFTVGSQRPNTEPFIFPGLGRRIVDLGCMANLKRTIWCIQRNYIVSKFKFANIFNPNLKTQLQW